MNDTKKDRQWLDSFTLELAHRGISGQDIGDAKASVESHLADSGESAEAAFGDPVVYAQALEFSGGRAGKFPRVLLPALLGILGLMYYLPAIGPAVQGQPVSFAGTEFALFVVLGLTMLLVVKNIFRLVKRWWILLAIWAAVVGIGVLASLLPLLLDLPALEANSAIVATVSGILILGAGFWTRAEIASSDNLVTPPSTAQTDNSDSTLERVMVVLAPWLITIGAVIFTAGAFLAA